MANVKAAVPPGAPGVRTEVVQIFNGEDLKPAQKATLLQALDTGVLLAGGRSPLANLAGFLMASQNLMVCAVWTDPKSQNRLERPPVTEFLLPKRTISLTREKLGPLLTVAEARLRVGGYDGPAISGGIFWATVRGLIVKKDVKMILETVGPLMRSQPGWDRGARHVRRIIESGEDFRLGRK